MLRLEKACLEDRDLVCAFYEEVCRALETAEYGPAWHYGIYPSETDLEACIRAGELFLGFEGETPAVALVLREGEDPIYAGAPWRVSTGAIRVLHLFAVHPAYWRRGLGREALALLEREADRSGTAIRLDVVKGNLPAERMYQQAGFRFVEDQVVFYEDTGELAVSLYEYP